MSTDLNLNDPALRANAVKAARGLRAFDKLVRNALMLDNGRSISDLLAR